MVTASFEKTKSNVVRLVVLGDQITAFINGQLAYTAQDPAGSAVYVNHGLSAYNQVACEFEHFKYWDLREMDSAVKTALAAIQNEEPLYQTSFDSWDFGESSWKCHYREWEADRHQLQSGACGRRSKQPYFRQVRGRIRASHFGFWSRSLHL